MKIKIGFTTEELMQEIKTQLGKSLYIKHSSKGIEVLNADKTDLNQTEKDSIQTFLKNNQVRII